MRQTLNNVAGGIPAVARDFQPEWALVLGSGLTASIEAAATLPYSAIPDLPVPRVAGHDGRFVFAELGGKRTVIAAGRVHLYEGYTAVNVTAHVRCMAAMGARKLVLTNAAGSLNPDFAPGTWMLLSDHLNLTGTSPLIGDPGFPDMSEVYSRKLRNVFARAAAVNGMPLHEGIYAGLLGPQYETPAEVRMLRILGADAVGMSTVLEAIQARVLGLEVAGFSCLSNWAAGMREATLNHAEVLEAGCQASGALMRLLTDALASS